MFLKEKLKKIFAEKIIVDKQLYCSQENLVMTLDKVFYMKK